MADEFCKFSNSPANNILRDESTPPANSLSSSGTPRPHSIDSILSNRETPSLQNVTPQPFGSSEGASQGSDASGSPATFGNSQEFLGSMGPNNLALVMPLAWATFAPVMLSPNLLSIGTPMYVPATFPQTTGNIPLISNGLTLGTGYKQLLAGKTTRKPTSVLLCGSNDFRVISTKEFIDKQLKFKKGVKREQLEPLLDSFLGDVFPSKQELERLEDLTKLDNRFIRKYFSDRRKQLDGGHNKGDKTKKLIVQQIQKNSNLKLIPTTLGATNESCFFIEGLDNEGKKWRMKNQILESLD